MGKKHILTSFDEGSKGEKIVAEIYRKYGYDVRKSDGKIAHDLVISRDGADIYTVEVKFDIMSKRTGNFAIEYFNSKSNKPSGITATQAKYWCHIVFDKEGNQYVYIAAVEHLKKWISETKPLKTIKSGGDDNADLYIYPLSEFNTDCVYTHDHPLYKNNPWMMLEQMLELIEMLAAPFKEKQL